MSANYIPMRTSSYKEGICINDHNELIKNGLVINDPEENKKVLDKYLNSKNLDEGSFLNRFINKFLNRKSRQFIEIDKALSESTNVLKYNFNILLRETIGARINSLLPDRTFLSCFSAYELKMNVDTIKMGLDNTDAMVMLQLGSMEKVRKKYQISDVLRDKINELEQEYEMIMVDKVDALRESIINFYIDCIIKYDADMPLEVFEKKCNDIFKEHYFLFYNTMNAYDFDRYCASLLFPSVGRFSDIRNNGIKNKDQIIDIACFLKLAKVLPNIDNQKCTSRYAIRLNKVKETANFLLEEVKKSEFKNELFELLNKFDNVLNVQVDKFEKQIDFGR